MDQENQYGAQVIQTDAGAKDGQTKCPKCGSTDISVNAHKGVLRCNFCRHEFQPEKAAGMDQDISQLSGMVIGSGAQDLGVNADSGDMMTLKCSSCGAEVVIDTAEVTQARCHWCRNMLSINQQIPNGAVPDAVLPFKLTKQDAQAEINKFVGGRKFFANPTFKKEFTTENIMGVYMPYMSINVNAHASLRGQGEHKTRSYTLRMGDGARTYYDADVFNVERDYDVMVNGLTLESNSQRMNNINGQTNNIINSIMPFDVENCVKWDSNYLHGYTSEKRDTNIGDLKNKADAQATDVCVFAANDTLQYYDRGVAWNTKDVQIKGEQWSAVYLPVWLYSYFEKKGKGGILHYVAVNARTKETMGSIPIHMPLLIFMSALIEIAGFLRMVVYRF